MNAGSFIRDEDASSRRQRALEEQKTQMYFNDSLIPNPERRMSTTSVSSIYLDCYLNQSCEDDEAGITEPVSQQHNNETVNEEQFTGGRASETLGFVLADETSSNDSDPSLTPPIEYIWTFDNEPIVGSSDEQKACSLLLDDSYGFNPTVELKNKWKSLEKAMKKSKESQKAIQAWDRKMGLKRCHSKTMLRSAKTRMQVRAIVKRELEYLTKTPSS